MDIYNDKYESYWYSGAHGVLISSAHKLMELGVDDRFNNKVLEIGGGAMPHKQWIKKGKIVEYTISDNKDVLEKIKTPYDYQFHFFDHDQNMNQLKSDYYSRIIAAQVWGHIQEPEKSFLQWINLLDDDGLLSISIPCDPGMLWRLGQKIASRKFMKLYDVSFEEYDIIMSREHINPVQRMLKIINYYFKKKSIMYFPSVIPVVNLNLFCIINVYKKDYIKRESY